MQIADICRYLLSLRSLLPPLSLSLQANAKANAKANANICKCIYLMAHGLKAALRELAALPVMNKRLRTLPPLATLPVLALDPWSLQFLAVAKPQLVVRAS